MRDLNVGHDKVNVNGGAIALSHPLGACEAAWVGDGWTLRELRTSFVSLMSHHGVSIEEIARVAGHARWPHPRRSR